MRKRRGERPECADCLIDTLDIDEIYMVTNEVWSGMSVMCPTIGRAFYYAR